MRITALLFFLSLIVSADDFPFDRFKGQKFPKFTRDEIKSLLDLSKDQSMTPNCPANLLSSYHLRECPRGTVALWVIEGNRVGDYPSLNPILIDVRDRIASDFPSSDPLKTQTKTQRELLGIARAKYRTWWAKGAKGDPLKGSNLAWY
ncbi:MAG: DUF4943 family protein [Bdellovibrionia bacterium]